MEKLLKSIFILLLVALSLSKPDEDKVINFTQYGYDKSDMYSGYLKVGKSFGSKKLHYFFIESQNKPDSDPLVLWLNGGPGCSSLEGMVSENGPRIFKEKTKVLRDNEYSWNKIANVIFLEAPVGVGFSSGFHEFLTDELVATDNLNALVAFFEKFPEYKNREFYITGESYAGVYIPHLASKIIDYNAKGHGDKINLKGLMIGNGVTDPNLDMTNAAVDFAYEHGLYGYEQRQEFLQACGTERPVPKTAACSIQVSKIMSIFQKINIYNVYGKCLVSGSQMTEEDKLLQRKGFGGFKGRYPKTPFVHPAAQGLKEDDISSPHLETSLRFLSEEDDNGSTPPCADGVGSTWFFNQPDVQKAMHVDRTEWGICNMVINITYQRDPKGSYYLYPKLINNNIRIWKYSGDVDCAVPYNGTQKWISNLNLKILEPYKSWSIDSEMVAGYVTKYNGLTFVTVKGAGHMVPSDKPAEALHLLQSFLNNTDL